MTPWKLLAICGLVLVSACGSEPERPADEAQTITWEELLPDGELERLTQQYMSQEAIGLSVIEGSAEDVAVQLGSYETVDGLDGQRIRLPGYTVPFEFGPDIEIDDFLLVPYFGACLHLPPPPPNQTIYVRSKTPINMSDLTQAMWIEGVLRVQTRASETADAAYTIELQKLTPYR